MKAIINNLLYDTDKSTLIVFIKEIQRFVYITEHKRLFMVDSCHSYITTADHDNCKELLARYALDKYIEIFGEVEDA